MDKKEIEDILKYDGLMQEYCNKVVPGFWQYVENNRQRYNNFLKRFFDFYLFSSYLVDEGLFKNKPRNEYPLKILYCKAAVSYFGIYNCFASGCISEAAVLNRSLFEALVNLKLILQEDTLTRLKLYDDYRFVSEWLNMQANSSDYKSEKRKLVEHHQYDKVKANYHPKRPYHWAWKIYCKELKNRNLNLKFMCKKLGLMDDYNKVYSAFSILAHAQPHDILYKLEGKITIAPIYSEKMYLVGLLSLLYFKDIIDLIVNYCKFDCPEDIHLYISLFLLDFKEKYCKN